MNCITAATLLLYSAAPAFAQCGEERWSVKTGTDSDAGLLNLNTAVSTTVASLTALSAPATLPDSSRIQPTETTLFVLTGTLTEYVLEDDSDYHLILSDGNGRTMIAEIPSPACVGAGSPFAAGIANARKEFDARYTADTSFKSANIPVQVKGAGFFDFLHGQDGVASNGIELHPVLDIIFNPDAASPPVIASVDTAGGFPGIAQNDWIEIKGSNLEPASAGAGLTWSAAPDFASGKMPAALGGVSVTVDGKPAFVSFISPAQVNVLTPLDGTVGTAPIVVTTNGVSSVPYTATMLAAAPSLLRAGASNYVAAVHGGSPETLVGPGSPAQPGETIVLYGAGFGLPVTSIVNGSATQSGALPQLPAIQIGGAAAEVLYAGVISPGLYQFNVVVPPGASNGDNVVSASYAGLSTPSGALLSVQK